MLVLSRKPEETIVFPELGITVEVIRTKGNTVRLGIKAPDSVRILRGELESIVAEFEDCTLDDSTLEDSTQYAMPSPTAASSFQSTVA